MKYSVVIGITLKVMVSLFFQLYPETKMMPSNYLFYREKQQILTCENQLSVYQIISCRSVFCQLITRLIVSALKVPKSCLFKINSARSWEFH